MKILRRPFTIAVLISLGWHLFLGSAFCIVLTPAKFDGVSGYAPINFLGPLLLEDIAVKTSTRFEPEFASMHPEGRTSGEETFYAKPERPKKEVPASRLDDTAIAKEKEIGQGYVSLYNKSIAPFLYQQQQEYQPKVLDITGPIAGRGIVYKPELPLTIKWPAKTIHDQDMDSFELVLRFYVSPVGEVESVEKIYSSGYQDIDIIGIRYIKMWQFAPVSGKEPQMGQIRINFKQK